MTAVCDSTQTRDIKLEEGPLPPDCQGVDILDIFLPLEDGANSDGILQIEVSYHGASGSHDFLARWDGSWIDTELPGLTVLLGHRRLRESDARPTLETFRIDMSVALRERSKLWAMVIANSTMSPAAQISLGSLER